MKRWLVVLSLTVFNFFHPADAQVKWQNISNEFGPLPTDVQVFESTDRIEEEPNKMFYVSVPLDHKKYDFRADTTMNRRITAHDFYLKNDSPIVVINAGFFSFGTHQNLNVVMDHKRLEGLNSQSIQIKKGKDSGQFVHPFYGTFGIDKKGRADVAWTMTDSSGPRIWASQSPVSKLVNDKANLSKKDLPKKDRKKFSKWKMKTAVGGGPVLVQEGKIMISNDIEGKFAGKAIDDRHPRSAIGYTGDGRLIVFACEGRSATAAGLSLIQMAGIMKDLGCKEALNLDGGGSTTLLVNGKEVNYPSSKGVQRMIPSVFIVKEAE